MSPQSVPSKAVKTLKKRSDFLRTYKGLQIRKEFLVLYCRKNDLGLTRLGITVPKTAGSAVTRNRLKRWVKEEMRKAHELSTSTDFHVFMKTKSKNKDDYKTVSHEIIAKELNEAIKQALRKH